MNKRFEQEADRIRIRYQRRMMLPPGRYAYTDEAFVRMVQERERIFLQFIKEKVRRAFQEMSVLDVGCGGGTLLCDFLKYGVPAEKLYGVDLIERSVEVARKRHPLWNIVCGNATELPFDANRFDVVCQCTVFSSILDPLMQQSVAREMVRVLRDDGIILWYDFTWHNPYNPDVAGVSVKMLRRLFPEMEMDIRRVTLAPPIARAASRLGTAFLAVLEMIPLLKTHIVAAITKR